MHSTHSGKPEGKSAMTAIKHEAEPLRALAERARFQLFSRDILRLSDLDHQKHINNAVYPCLFTNGRYALIRERLRDYVTSTDAFALAKITIEYLNEMHFPGEVEVGTLVRRIGTTSITYGQAIFYKDKCAAVAESVMVMVDGRTRRPKPLPAAVVAELRKLAG
jgi:acyl-CoA thioester hydrolase